MIESRVTSPSFLSAFIKYENGKLEEGTRYAVFQRSFTADYEYENEGFITFTTKDIDNEFPTTTLVLSIVVGFLVLVILAGGIVMWRRLHPNGEF